MKLKYCAKCGKATPHSELCDVLFQFGDDEEMKKGKRLQCIFCGFTFDTLRVKYVEMYFSVDLPVMP